MFFCVTLTCALAAKAAVQQTAMRSESFIVPRSTIRAPFYNSALTVCQGFTAAQWWRKSNGSCHFRFRSTRALACWSAPRQNRGLSHSMYAGRAKPCGFGEGAETCHARRVRSQTFIASCENGALCYIHAFNFLPSPVMPNYCLLLGCAATLSFTVALAAQPTPATKPAIPAHSIEAAPKAVSANVEKEAARKDSSPAEGTGHYIQLGACRRTLHRDDL